MTQRQRQNLESLARQQLDRGDLRACVDTYRSLGRSTRYVVKLRKIGDASLRSGDRGHAIAAFVAASFLEVGDHAPARGKRRAA
jgi:hypothetical protein